MSAPSPQPAPVVAAKGIPPWPTTSTGASIDLGCGSVKRATLGVDLYGDQADFRFPLHEFPWPLKDASYDRVHAHEVLEHLPWDGIERDETLHRFMKEVARILRPGGEFVGDVPHAEGRNALGSPCHRRLFTELTLSHFAQATNHPIKPARQEAERIFRHLDLCVDREFRLGKVSEFHFKKYAPVLYRVAVGAHVGHRSTIHFRYRL